MTTNLPEQLTDREREELDNIDPVTVLRLARSVLRDNGGLNTVFTQYDGSDVVTRLTLGEMIESVIERLTEK